MEKKCQSCDNVFYKKPNESKKYWATKKYCSHKCSLQFTSVKRFDGGRGRIVSDETRRKISISCKGRPANYTSFKKGNIPWSKLNGMPKGSNSKKWNSIEKTCLNCGKTILVQPYRLETQKWCDVRCYMKWRRGKNNPHFKGNEAVCLLKKRIRGIAEHKEWHKDILRRDNWTCQCCGDKRNIEVHHLKSFFDIYKEFNLKTIEDARNCEILWDITNGQTLCRRCHRKTDSYGRQNANS